MIELKNVCAGYEGKNVLHYANVVFEPGNITVLVGPNGCGKSTLLKTIVRINPHCEGEILIDGISIKNMTSRELARKAAYLAQNKKAPDISVLKMVLHGRFAHLSYPRKYRSKDVEIAKSALCWAGMETQADKLVSKLSGGMQQKVYIAMALAQDADTILMDEPTTYLDVAHQLRLMEMARQLAREGKVIVMVLHDLTQALQIADKVVVLKEGEIISQGTPDEIFESGSLQKAFHVEIERVHTKSGWHYLCTLPE